MNKIYSLFITLIITALVIFGYSSHSDATSVSKTGVPIDQFDGTIQKLRALNGQTGDIATVTQPTISSGSFTWSETDPNSNGDDNGIVIKASNGWWVRLFNHSQAQPIELDWFNLPDNTNVTQTFKDILTAYAPNLHLKMPTVPKKIILDYIEVTKITNFNLYRGHPNVVIKHPALPSDKNIMLHVKNYDTVVIESGITFEGRHDIYTPINSRNTGTNGLLQFEITNKKNPTSLTTHCDVKNAVQHGFAHKSKSSGRTELATIGGTYTTAGVQFNKGVKNLVLDNLVIKDPLGEGFGVNRNDTANPVSANIKYHQKVRKLSLTRLDSISGKYTGVNAGWFINSTKILGINANEPLHIIMKDMGWLADGREISRPKGIQTKGGKFDSLAHPSIRGSRFVKLEMAGKAPSLGIQFPAIFEATPDSDRNYYLENINLELVNVRAGGLLMTNSYTTGRGFTGQIKNNTISGTANGFLIRNSDNTFENLTFEIIHIARHHRPPSNRVDNITIRNSRLVSNNTLKSKTTGFIKIETGQGHIIDNLTVTGEPRDIIIISNVFTISKGVNGPEPDPITLTISNLTAPSGSKIIADDASIVTVKLDGNPITLPYTVP